MKVQTGFEDDPRARRDLGSPGRAIDTSRKDGGGALRARAAAVAPLTKPKPPARQPAGAPAPRPAPAANAVVLGESEVGQNIDLDLVKLLDGRLLVQGVSGAGKSWTLRRILERSAQRIQQIVIDPEGEFGSLAAVLDYPYIDGARLDTAALSTLARRAREHRLSLILNLSELDREGQMIAVAAFLNPLIECPRELWSPSLVAVDEAHLFAPFGGALVGATSVRKEAIAAVTDLMARGRKRGLAGVLATQRLAKLSKSVVSEVHNFLVGLNTLDLDIKRAAETIGWETRKASDRLPLLAPGNFVAVGPAFSQSPVILKVGAVKSRHVGATPDMLTPATASAEEAQRALDVDRLVAETAAAAALRGSGTDPAAARALREFVASRSFPLAGRVFEALEGIAPDGALASKLAGHLAVPEEAIAQAIALLTAADAVQISGSGKTAVVRVAPAILEERA